MKEELKTINNIANIIHLNLDTLRLYLSRSEFFKYIQKEKINNRWRTVYLFNNDFVKDLKNILDTKRRYDCINFLSEYVNDGKTVDLVAENRKLKESLDLAVKQHEMLVKKYHELLDKYKAATVS